MIDNYYAVSGEINLLFSPIAIYLTFPLISLVYKQKQTIFFELIYSRS
jgi:hypothetical protein